MSKEELIVELEKLTSGERWEIMGPFLVAGAAIRGSIGRADRGGEGHPG
jgi:hypothetical protein